MRLNCVVMTPTAGLGDPTASDGPSRTRPPHDVVAREYFDRSQRAGVKGTVETPGWLVDAMVDIAIQSLTAAPHPTVDLENVRWLDPCCGAGAFVLGVLGRYLQGPVAGVADLPRITAIDLAPDALEATRLGVERVLSRHGLSIDEYLNSGRLILETGDFLQMGRDDPTLGDELHDLFDVVIGNPPYVRSRDWLPEQRSSVGAAFPHLVRGGCDLYGYFYVAAMNVVRSGGVVSFVTPFSFLRVSSALNVRERLLSISRLRSVVDLGETGVFGDVALHAGVFTFRRETGDRRAKWGTVRKPLKSAQANLASAEWLGGVIEPNSVGGWHFQRASTAAARPECRLKSLSEFGIGVYSGIRPGVSKAFLVSDEQRGAFRSEASIQHMRPVIAAREIQLWRSASHKHWIIDSRANGGEIGDELMGHLGQFRELLERRPEVGKTAKWFQLRTCAYMDLMMREKIAFPDISKEQRFSIVPAGILILDGAFFIDSCRPALLGILNSSFAQRFFEANCPIIGTPGLGGRLRYKKSVLARFPLPASWLENSSVITQLDGVVSEVINDGGASRDSVRRIDELVEDLYEGACRS